MSHNVEALESPLVPVRECLGNVLKHKGLHGNGIEIGVYEGQFSEVIVRYFGLNRVYLLDGWRKYENYNDKADASEREISLRYELVKEKMKKYGDRVHIIKLDSEKAVNIFEDEYFDFIYLDANHSYEAVKNDLESWFPKLSPGGVFGCHDYCNTTASKTGSDIMVEKALNEFCSGRSLPIYMAYMDVPVHFRQRTAFFVKE